MDSDNIKIRDELIWFSNNMERVLRSNDHKGGWRECSNSYLLMRIIEEIGELMKAIEYGNCSVVDECVDVANFAMMIADNHRCKHGS